MGRKTGLLGACVILAAVIGGTYDLKAADQETLTNDAVVALVKAGLGTGTIVAKVRASIAQFDVSTKGLIDLKSKGVPDDVIQAMLETSVKPASGATVPASGTVRLFLLRANPDGETIRQPIEPSFARQRFAVGLFSAGTQVVLAGKNSALQIPEPRPSFAFQFPGDSDSPARYILTRLGPSDEGNGRKIDLDAAVRFDVQRTGQGEFKVTPQADLRRGEYCFYAADEAKEGWLGAQQGSL